MYCHPSQVRNWRKFLKPLATPEQVEQAALMRAAKQAKKIFQQRQKLLF